MRHYPSARALTLAAVALGALTMTACASSAAAPGGTATGKQLSGAPIVIYSISTESGSAIAPLSEEEQRGGEAAADYVNAHGGVDGRPIKIVTCDEQYSAAGALSCAQQAVAAHAVAVAGFSFFLGASGLTTLESAGIPSLNVPSNPAEYTNPISFPIYGGSQSFGGSLALIAADVIKATSMVVVSPDDAASHETVAGLQALANAKKLGLRVSAVYIPPTAPDVTPYVDKAASMHPGAIAEQLYGSAVITSLSALKQAGYPMSKVILSGSVADESLIISKAPAGEFNDVYFGYALDSYDDTANPDVSLYLEAMKEFDGGQSAKALDLQVGFSQVMEVVQAGQSIGGANLSAKTFLSYLRAPGTRHVFMGATASRSLAPSGYPSMQNPWIRAVQMQGTTLKDVGGWINPFS
jgi:ABC-type branched-subunit amino acid transport system substrate-binding protein